VTLILRGTRTATAPGGVYANVSTDGYKLLDFDAAHYFGLVDAEGADTLTDVEIGDGVIDDIDRIFTHSAAPKVDGLYIHDIKATNLERGLIRIKLADNVIIRRVHATQQAKKTTAFSDAFATTDVATHNVLVEDVVFIGFRMEVASGDYPNGGAFSDEEQSTGHIYRRCLAEQGNDGWDVKSIDAILDRCVARSNRRNFRLWGPNTTATDCVSSFVAADYTKSYVDSAGVTRTDLRPNAHWWFDSGRMTGATLIRPRFGDVAGSTVPYLKIEGGADVGATVRVIDPMDLDGNIIPRAAFLARVVQTDDGKTDVTVVVEYTGPTSFGPVDTTPQPPRVTALGTAAVPTPPPAGVQAPPTNVTAVLNSDSTITVRGSTPAGASAIEVYESVHADNTVPRIKITNPGPSWVYTTSPRAASSSYKYTALAVAADGVTKSTRTASSPTTITTPAAPPAVVASTVTVTGAPGDGRATLTWDLQPGNDGANGVRLGRNGTDSTGAGPWTSENYLADQGSLIFTRLVNGTAYELTAYPTRDGVLVGTPSSVTVTPASAPPPPSEEPVDPDTSEIDDLRAENASLSAQVQALTAQVSDLSTELDSTAEELAECEADLASQTARANAAIQRLADIDLEAVVPAPGSSSDKSARIARIDALANLTTTPLVY
jgi:hypothetical protein